MYCPKCGTQNDDNNYRCIKCGHVLQPVKQTPPVQTEGILSTIIPYKNASALTAYYLGVFSVLPLIGIVLGIAAFILGLKGLQFAKEHPEAKGKIHAWIGILVGGVFGFGYLIFTLFLIGSAVFQW